MTSRSAPSDKRSQGPQPGSINYELALSRDFAPETDSYRSSQYWVFSKKHASKLRLELVRFKGLIMGYDLFHKLVKLLEWNLDTATLEPPTDNQQTGEPSEKVVDKENSKKRKDSHRLSPESGEVNPLMSQSVDDFFASASRTPSPTRPTRPTGRLLPLPQLNDLDRYSDVFNGIKTSPFHPSVPLWEPEINEFQDPHVLYWLPEGKSFLLMNKDSKRVYVRRPDLGFYLVKRLKKPSGLEGSGLEGDDEGYVLL